MQTKSVVKIRNGLYTSIRNSVNFRQLLESKQVFDVVLVEAVFCEEMHGLGHHFNAPIISIAPVLESAEMNGWTAMPALKSFMPTIFLGYTNRMNFWERLHNVISHVAVLYFIRSLNMPEHQRNYELLFPSSGNSLPLLSELKRNVSLILVNSDASTSPSRPLMPNIIEIGGLCIKPDEIEMMPRDIQIFLDEALDGAVYFSFGSIQNGSNLPLQTRNQFIRTFSELSGIRFLVKGDEAFLGLSENLPNVLVRSWFPQKAILMHPNLKCFITHGGYNSIQETIYYGKPIVVIPLFFDQFLNARFASETGYGIELSIHDMTSNTLKSAIEEILFNPRFVVEYKMFYFSGRNV